MKNIKIKLKIELNNFELHFFNIKRHSGYAIQSD
jgi:hypothetical protein